MITLTLDPPGSSSCGNHISTDWQIATDPGFINIIHESLSDSVNLLTYNYFYTEVVPKLFARARMHFDTCSSDWLVILLSNEDLIDNVIERPTVSLVINPSTNESVIQGSSFTLTAGSGETHISTDWEVKDKNNNILFSEYGDTVNLESKLIPDGLLITDEVYALFVRYNGNTTKSNFGGVVSRFSVVPPIIETPTVLADQPEGFIPEETTFTASPFTMVQGVDTHISTTWRIYEINEGPDVLVYESIENTVNLTTLDPGITFDPQIDYVVYVTYHGEFVSSDVSDEYTFRPTYFWIDSPYFTIEGQYNNVDQGPLITINSSVNYNLPPSETITNWRIDIENLSTNIVVYTTSDTWPNNLAHQVPEETLTIGDDYIFNVYIITNTGRESRGYRIINDIKPSPGPIEPFDVNVDGGPNNVSTGPFIAAGEFISNEGETHASTTWRVINDATSSVLWESVDDIVNLNLIKIPENTLPIGVNNLTVIVEYKDSADNTREMSASISEIKELMGWVYKDESDIVNRRKNFKIEYLKDNKYIILGAEDSSNNTLDEILIFDATTESLTTSIMVNPYPTAKPDVVKLKDGRILVVGGWSDAEGGNSLRTYIIDNNDITNWTRAADTIAARSSAPTLKLSKQTIISFGNNKVMLLGGYDYSGSFTFTDSSFIYDVATDQWSLGPTMPIAASSLAAAELDDGRILIAGGKIGSAVPNYNAYIYDFNSDSWTQIATMPEKRYNGFSTALSNNRFSIFQAESGGKSLLYHIADDVWTSGRFYPTDNIEWSYTYGACAKNTDDNSILYINMNSQPYQKGIAIHFEEDIRIEDPAIAIEGDPGNVPLNPFIESSPFLDLSGRVTYSYLNYEIYDDTSYLIKSGFLNETSSYPFKIFTEPYKYQTGETYTVKILMAGKDLTNPAQSGHTSSWVEKDFTIDHPPFTYTYHTSASIPAPHPRNYGFSIDNFGNVVLTGGRASGQTNRIDTVSIYNPSTDTWSNGISMPIPLSDHRQTTLDSGDILVMSGSNGSLPVNNDIFVFDNINNIWVTKVMSNPSSVDYARVQFSVTALSNNKAFVAGGMVKIGANYELTKSSFILDLTADTITPIADLPIELKAHGQIVLPNGNILVMGGKKLIPNTTSVEPNTEIFEYDINTDTWSVFDDLNIILDETYTSVTLLKDSSGNPTDEMYIIGNSSYGGIWVIIYDYVTKTRRFETQISHSTDIFDVDTLPTIGYKLVLPAFNYFNDYLVIQD